MVVYALVRVVTANEQLMHRQPARISPTQPQPERRREPRYPTNDAVEITVLAEPPLWFAGRVLDVSRSGLRVALLSPLDPGTQVRITFRRPAVIFAEVRHCKWAGDAFHVGLRIEDVLISPNRHVDEDELELYLSSKGLTEAEFFYVRLHFSDCPECQTRLREREESVG